MLGIWAIRDCVQRTWHGCGGGAGIKYLSCIEKQERPHSMRLKARPKLIWAHVWRVDRHSGGCACGWSIIHGGKGTTKKQNRVLTINACEQALTSRSECKCYFSMLKHTRRCGNCSVTSICLLVLFSPIISHDKITA